MNKQTQAILYIVATPIGNLQDISSRAIKILNSVSVIAAEDTRHTGILLRSLNISKSIVSLHRHNEATRAERLLQNLRQGNSVALVCDAGTPLISDPGDILVQAVWQAGFKVVPVPGPCALVAALSVCGFSIEKFLFVGFLPAKPLARLQILQELKYEKNTMVFYEAPHRIQASLEDMLTVFGENRQVAQVRELTKIFETVNRGTLGQVLQIITQDINQQRGEQVIVVAGSEVEPDLLSVDMEHVLQTLLQQLSLKQAVDLTVKITGCARNIIYRKALNILKK